MATYATLNITVRNKDLTPIAKADLDKFDDFFFNDFAPCAILTSPYLCTDGMSIYAQCEVKWGLEPSELQPFAKANPHLQIEVMEDIDSDDAGRSRCLFEGEICEWLSEVCIWEEPKKINWPSFNAGEEYETANQLREAMEDPAFAQWLGRKMREFFLIDPDTNAELGSQVSSAYLNGRVDELFTALAGMPMTLALKRWKESKTYQEVTS